MFSVLAVFGVLDDALFVAKARSSPCRSLLLLIATNRRQVCCATANSQNTADLRLGILLWVHKELGLMCVTLEWECWYSKPELSHSGTLPALLVGDRSLHKTHGDCGSWVLLFSVRARRTDCLVFMGLYCLHFKCRAGVPASWAIIFWGRGELLSVAGQRWSPFAFLLPAAWPSRWVFAEVLCTFILPHSTYDASEAHQRKKTYIPTKLQVSTCSLFPVAVCLRRNHGLISATIVTVVPVSFFRYSNTISTAFLQSSQLNAVPQLCTSCPNSFQRGSVLGWARTVYVLRTPAGWIVRRRSSSHLRQHKTKWKNQRDRFAGYLKVRWSAGLLASGRRHLRKPAALPVNRGSVVRVEHTFLCIGDSNM